MIWIIIFGSYSMQEILKKSECVQSAVIIHADQSVFSDCKYVVFK